MKNRNLSFLLLLIVSICLTRKVGAQWIQTNGAAGDYVSCFASQGGNLFAGTYGSGLFTSSDNGESWSDLGLDNFYTQSILAITSGLYVGGDSGVYVSLDTGKTWKRANVGLERPIGVQITSLAQMGSMLFAGTYGGLYVSTNYAGSWKLTCTSLPHAPESLEVLGDNIFIGGGGINRSSDSGTSCTAVNHGLPDSSLTNVWALKSNGIDLYAGLYGFGVFRSTDSGNSWSGSNIGLENPYINALARSGNYLFAGTYNGVFLSTNNGVNWTQVNSGLRDTEVKALIVSDQYLFAGTHSSGVWRRALSDFTAGSVAYQKTADIPPLLYPNPTMGRVRISLGSNTNTQVSVTSTLGEIVERVYLHNKSEYSLNLSNLPAGVYYMQIRSDRGIVLKKLLKE